MAPFDIAGLDLRELTPEEVVDYSQGYQAGGEFQPPPPEGQYLAKCSVKPAQHKEKILAVDITGEIVGTVDGGTTGAGYKVYQSKASIKKYRNRNGSPVGDFLAAHGIVAEGTPTVAEYATAIGSTDGQIAPFVGQWEAYCKDCEETVQGADQFPVNPDGTRNYRRACPQCRKDILARLRIRRWVPTGAAAEATK